MKYTGGGGVIPPPVASLVELAQVQRLHRQRVGEPAAVLPLRNARMGAVGARRSGWEDDEAKVERDRRRGRVATQNITHGGGRGGGGGGRGGERGGGAQPYRRHDRGWQPMATAATAGSTAWEAHPRRASAGGPRAPARARRGSRRARAGGCPRTPPPTARLGCTRGPHCRARTARQSGSLA